MAQDLNKKVLNVANKISSNMGTTALKYREKTDCDKSFAVTILGVNQKFTGNVSAEDQTTLITKYSIPATIEEGDPNYYTIKIYGAYYVVIQTAYFMLYDKLMAYLPNGDWSQMYLDYRSGGKGDGEKVDLPVVYHTPYTVDPADEYEVKDGDYWIAVESAQNDQFKYFKQRIDGEWITYCSASHDLNITIERAIIVQRDDLV